MHLRNLDAIGSPTTGLGGVFLKILQVLQLFVIFTISFFELVLFFQFSPAESINFINLLDVLWQCLYLSCYES